MLEPRVLLVSQAKPSEELKIHSETPAQVEGSLALSLRQPCLAGGWSRITSRSLRQLYSSPCPTLFCLPSASRTS